MKIPKTTQTKITTLPSQKQTTLEKFVNKKVKTMSDNEIIVPYLAKLPKRMFIMLRSIAHPPQHKEPRHKFNKTKATLRKVRLIKANRLRVLQSLNLNDENAPKKHRGRQKKSQEDLVAQYNKDHPWVYAENGALFCRYCVRYCQEHNVVFIHNNDKFFIYNGSKYFKKYTMQRHSTRRLHKKATLLFGNEQERLSIRQLDTSIKLKEMMIKASTIQKSDPFLPIMKTVLYIAKNSLSLSQSQELANFLQSNEVTISKHYRDRSTAVELLHFMSDHTRDELIAKMRESEFIGIQLDESKDSSCHEIMTVNVKYLEDGKPRNAFLTVLDLPKTNALTIFTVLKSKLEEFGLYDKVRSLCTDGARNVSSRKNGLAGLLLQDIPSLQTIHCVTHRLNLGVSNFWKIDVYMQRINQVMFSLCKVFAYSPRKVNLLEAKEKDLLNLNLHLIKPIDERWLSHFKAIERLLKIYPAIIFTLKQLLKEGDITIYGILKCLEEFSTIAHMHILSDLYTIIDPLNLKLQKKDLSFEVLEGSLIIAQASLKRMVEGQIGPCLARFINGINKDRKFFSTTFPQESIDLDLIKRRNSDVAQMILLNINKRFEMVPSMKNFDIFRIESLKKINDLKKLKSYGNIQINALSNIFRMNYTLIADQWTKFKDLVLAYKDREEAEIWKLCFSLEELTDLNKLLKIYLTIPISTVECERVFSRMNFIKNDTRSSLKTSTLDSLLNLTLNTSQDINDFDCTTVFEKWKVAKNRYFISELEK